MGKGGVGKDGGKAKPLKAPKKGAKEYDEARYYVQAPAAQPRGTYSRAPTPQDDLAFLEKKKQEAKARSSGDCSKSDECWRTAARRCMAALNSSNLACMHAHSHEAPARALEWQNARAALEAGVERREPYALRCFAD